MTVKAYPGGASNVCSPEGAATAWGRIRTIFSGSQNSGNQKGPRGVELMRRNPDSPKKTRRYTRSAPANTGGLIAVTIQTEFKLLPRGLTKAQKSAFMRVVEARQSAGDPVQPIEVDLVCDYVAARARLAHLERMSRAKEAPFFDDKLKMVASIDRAAGSCRRLAKDLRLVSKAPTRSAGR